MNLRRLAFVSAAMLVSFASPSITQTSEALVVAVSRNDSVLSGGIGTGSNAAPGKINLEILAYVSADGQWKSHPCAQNYTKACEKFARDYLGKSQTYTVISADGRGATITSAPTALDECYDYTTTGSYAGAAIRATTIATDAPDFFSPGQPATQLPEEEARIVLRQLKSLIPARLDSIEKLRTYKVQLERHDFFVIQRAFRDYALDPRYDTGQGSLKFIFGIAALEQGQLHILYWKKNIEDANEQVLATIHLKTGRDFLVTTISDPESQTFHVYGIRGGKLSLVYSGGGSSC